MSTYKELTEKYKKDVKKLQEEDCKHEELNNWEPGNWKNYFPNPEDTLLHDDKQKLETKRCKKCNLLLGKRTECLCCGNPIEEKDWVKTYSEEINTEFFEIPRAGVIYFCSEDCMEKYKSENENTLSSIKTEIKRITGKEMLKELFNLFHSRPPKKKKIKALKDIFEEQKQKKLLEAAKRQFGPDCLGY